MARDKYIVACSSFQYFPGIPLFESDDLIHFSQVGNAITRISQCDLTEVPSSGGIFAPTIRFHNGRFYLVTNDNTSGKNFYIYTDDIHGEWSDPVYVEQDGIDPSLLFDGDQVYFTSNGTDKNGNKCINQCLIDIDTGRKISETRPVWYGNGGRYLEGPHLYHIGKYYYLFAAEGGTEYGHMEVYARSERPDGPFVSYSDNPIITNRNLGGDESLIQGIGHADLIEKDGHFYLICLGFRQQGKWLAYHHLGREVFLTEIILDDDGWFVPAGDGTVREALPESLVVSGLNAYEEDSSEKNIVLTFETVPISDPRWISLRRPLNEMAEFSDGMLLLHPSEKSLNDRCPVFLGLRQSEMDTSLRVTVDTEHCLEAGISIYMSEECHYDLYVTSDSSHMRSVYVRLVTGDASEDDFIAEYDGKMTLEIESDAEEYRFYYYKNGARSLIRSARTKWLSSEVAGGFTGVVCGLYACGEKNDAALFSDFRMVQKLL